MTHLPHPDPFDGLLDYDDPRPPGGVSPKLPCGLTKLTEVQEHRLHVDLRKLAEDLFAAGDRIPVWQRPFRFVRVVRKYLPQSEPVSSLKKWCEVFGGMLPIQVGDFYSNAVCLWPIVRGADGIDAWDTAWQSAETLTVRFAHLDDEWQRLATTLFLLHLQSGGSPFPIPCSRIARSMGKSQPSASRIRHALVLLGILSIANPEYSYKDKECKTYHFIANPI